jgi:peroxiredoxin
MKKPGWITVFLIVACTSIFFSVQCCSRADDSGKEPHLKFTFPPPDSAQTQEYLGLDAMKRFKVSDIKAKIVVIEVMNSLCQACQANSPIMNEVYKTIQADSGLTDVKVIAIAIADDKTRVETFKKQFETPFPILIDENSEIMRALSLKATPTAIVVWTKDAKVLFTEPGVIPDADAFVKEVKFVKQLEVMNKEN